MRTKSEIKAAILDYALLYYPDLLPLLQSASKVGNVPALLGMWVDLVQQVEGQMDDHLADVQAYILASRPATLPWYEQKCREFQYGQNPTINEFGVFYSTLDAGARIVKLAKVRTSGLNGVDLVVMVMKLVGTTPTPLTTGELDAFRGYMQLAKIAGTKLDINSLPVNEVKFGLNLYHTGQAMDNFGKSLTDQTKYPIREAVKAYLLNLPQGGRFIVSDLVEYLMGQPGILDAQVTTPQYLDAGSVYQSINTGQYDPPSGFLNILDSSMNGWSYTKA